MSAILNEEEFRRILKRVHARAATDADADSLMEHCTTLKKQVAELEALIEGLVAVVKDQEAQIEDAAKEEWMRREGKAGV